MARHRRHGCICIWIRVGATIRKNMSLMEATFASYTKIKLAKLFVLSYQRPLKAQSLIASL